MMLGIQGLAELLVEHQISCYLVHFSVAPKTQQQSVADYRRWHGEDIRVLMIEK